MHLGMAYNYLLDIERIDKIQVGILHPYLELI